MTSVVSQTRKLRLGEIQGLTQGHIANEVAPPGLRLSSLPFPYQLHPLDTLYPWAVRPPLGRRDFTASSVLKFVSLPTHLNPYFKEKEKSPLQLTLGAQRK